MKEQDAEVRLARAIEDAAPNRLDELLEVREEARRQEKIVDISAPPKKKGRRWRNFAAAAAAALVLVIGGGSFFGWRYANTPDSLVGIDVNPSVQLSVSRNEKVLRCEALNAEGAEIIDGMDLQGAQLNVAVNALIGSMVQRGYIDDLKNSVLITVENKDAAKAQALQESLMADVNGLLAGESVDASVMTQTITIRDQTITSQAEAYGISEGKAALIQRILDTDPTLTFDALSGLSVNDLSLLLQAKQADTSGLTVTGQASDKAYIGLDKATEIVLAQLPGATLNEIEFDYDDGMVYEAELRKDGYEYDVEIDALTGAVVKWDYERDDHWSGSAGQPQTAPQQGTDSPQHSQGQEQTTATPQPSQSQEQTTAAPQPSQSQTALITEQQARDLVLAQVPGATIREFQRKTDDGRVVYEGEAFLDSREYEFEIDAATGTFLEWDADDVDEGWNQENTASAGQTALDEEGARALVLARIPGATIVEFERDIDDGRVCYEGEAFLDGWEYDFEIDATAGEFIKWEADNR